MELQKKHLVTAFKERAVLDHIEQGYLLKLSIDAQYQRDVWEITDRLLGIIRIENREKCLITIFPAVNNVFHLKEDHSFELTKNEYLELKTYKFGRDLT